MKKNLHELIDKVIGDLNHIKELYDKSTPTSKELENEFEQLKKLLHSDAWPVAAPENLICDHSSEDDKLERAYTVIDLMIDDKNLKELRLLDFGCGEGHTISVADAKLAVGYDIKEQNWQHFTLDEHKIFTDEWVNVEKFAPYDVVVVFDVFDHIEDETPVAALSKISDVLSPTGKIYVRTHPFTSRHATHLYYQINKAYLHLVFLPEELEELGLAVQSNLQVRTPILSYKHYFESANLRILSTKEIVEPVHNFFKQPLLAKRLTNHVGLGSFPEWQMSLQFVDYVLAK